ncbi:MAG: hypothetical protein K0R09_687 [Clostridiales bacterium]|jgi:hypothetical protein|nr:hypothetical protein [Clostridiales bacterium]
MIIYPSSIIIRINSDFTSVYKPFSNFPGSGLLWSECINSINDVKLMNHIIFCNDVMHIPPVKVFLMANNNLNQQFTDFEKKAMGAFWGFIFKSVFSYRLQKDSVPINTKGVKKATYFYDVSELVEVINEQQANL